VTQSGVDDDFTIDAPVEIQFAKGAPQTIWVRTSNEPAPFSVTLKHMPQRAVVSADVLASRK
jgi:hypothetical protein